MGDHEEITLSVAAMVWDAANDKAIAIVTEYRADGCVTWRRA